MTGSNWLDRLHLLKGFPVSDDFGLDHFLSHQNTLFEQTLAQNPSFIQQILPQNPNSVEHFKKNTNFIEIVQNCSVKVPNNPNLIAKVQKSPNSNEKVQKNPNCCEKVPEKPNSIEKVQKSPNSNEKVQNSPNLIEKVEKSPNSNEKVQKCCENVRKNLNCCAKVPKHHNSNEKAQKDSNFNEISNVLFDLFNFGESVNDPLFISQKCSRKQKKPKFCPTSNLSRKRENKVEKEVFKIKGDLEEKGSSDFIGYSRTNVTVIDTSHSKWKCERVVFRKNNLWRVRDRNRHSSKVEGKKRKDRNLEDENCNRIKKESKTLGSSKGNKQTEKMNKNPEEPRDTLHQVPNQRFPRKLKKGGSNGVLTKRTTSTKNG